MALNKTDERVRVRLEHLLMMQLSPLESLKGPQALHDLEPAIPVHDSMLLMHGLHDAPKTLFSSLLEATPQLRPTSRTTQSRSAFTYIKGVSYHGVKHWSAMQIHVLLARHIICNAK